MLRTLSRIALGFAALALLIAVAPAWARSQQDGTLKIHVSPKQAYVFVDGQAIRDGSQKIDLSAGRHTIAVYNYGYAPRTQAVDITAGRSTPLNVTLQPSGAKVDGPFGDIEFQGHPRAAVLLNGNTPPYFVGHVDEFDNSFVWHQWLLVKPGNYQVTVTQKGQTIWSGPVKVDAGKRVLINLNRNGRITTKNFKPGMTLGPQPRFDTGLASARVPIAPPTAQLAASQAQINCGQQATLNWKSADAVDTSINGLGNVPATGDRSVSPTTTTTYQLMAKGPGGEATPAATVAVNAQPEATLSFAQPQVSYHKIGDKVVEQGWTTLNWSAPNATRVTIQPLGSVPATGSRKIAAVTSQNNPGPVNQEVSYTLTAGNNCGGTTTRTATLHVVGSIDPAPPVILGSVFYPTNYPLRRNSRVGLLPSQEQVLAKAAETFNNSLQYAVQDRLTVVGYADVRGPQKYNLALSRRRADLVKDYLVSQGIAADKIQVRAEGKDHPLDRKQVATLQSSDAQKPPKWMAARKKSTWLAYNRRVDIVLEPAGQRSTQAFPNDVPDARLLWQRGTPKLARVEAVLRRSGTVSTVAAKR